MKVKSTKVSGESKFRKQVPIFVETIRPAHFLNCGGLFLNDKKPYDSFFADELRY